MTREEALKQLRELKFALSGTDEQFLDIVALDMAIEAIEKDIAKAPKKSDIPRYGMGYEYYDWCCPTCNKLLAFECDTKRQYIHHCECGQRLDWGKYDKRRSDSNY